MPYGRSCLQSEVKMKRNFKLILITLICTICLALIACGEIESIYFETEPRKTYVQGQEFTLDDSVLLGLSGDESSPISAEDVTISGYNKDQLGNQTVTITYDEDKTLEINVTVIPRIATEGITREYFVGDNFDKTKGRIRVADDNANIKTVNMSDAAVTVSGFDSSTAGTKTVTVKYGEYTGTFSINVYNAETVELSSPPKKTIYYSHDTEFSVAGAFFTVTANNGSLTRMIEATLDMVEGFDPSAATMEHMETPLKQTVKFKYLGKSFNFNITVRFSGVSLVLLRSEELKNVDPALATKEQSEKAFDALSKFVDLTPSEQKLIKNDTLQILLDIGIPYGAKLFAEEAESFSDTINLEYVKDSETERINAKVNITATSYEAVQRDLARLENEKDPFLTLASALYDMKEEFYHRKVDGKTVDEILSTVFDSDAVDEVKKAFKLLIELHKTLLPVPTNWTKDMLPDYENDIRSAVATINASDFKAFDGSATLYSILVGWREESKDFFDIIYAYYSYYDRDNMISALWEKIYMPGLLQELFTMHNLACQEAFDMRVGDDTTTFMYYYKRANQLAEEIKNGDNELHINIYNFFNFDRLISSYLYFGTAQIQDQSINGIAYVYHASSLLDNPIYEKLWTDFIELFKLSLQPGFSFSDEKVMEYAQGVLESYTELSPNERFAFLSSLHCDYRITTSTELVLSHSVDDDGILNCFSYFTYLLYSSYKEVLGEKAYIIFYNLIEATEMQALRYHNPEIYNGFTDANGKKHRGFIDTMKAIILDAATLDAAEKEPFAMLLAQMTEVYDDINNPPTPVITDAETALFNELRGTIETFYRFYNIASNEEIDSADKYKYYIIAFSAYERAKTIAAELRASEDDDVLYTLLYKETEFNIALDEDVNAASTTFDYMLDSIGSLMYMTILRDEIDTYNVCTVYLTYGIADFLDHAYDILLAEYDGNIDATYKDEIIALMAEYSTLTDNQIFTLNLLCASDYYFDAIEHCFEDSYDAEEMNVVTLLTEAGRKYADYVTGSKTQEGRANFISAFKALRDAHTALADKTDFDNDFAVIYAFYSLKYSFLG